MAIRTSCYADRSATVPSAVCLAGGTPASRMGRDRCRKCDLVGSERRDEDAASAGPTRIPRSVDNSIRARPHSLFSPKAVIPLTSGERRLSPRFRRSAPAERPILVIQHPFLRSQVRTGSFLIRDALDGRLQIGEFQFYRHRLLPFATIVPNDSNLNTGGAASASELASPDAVGFLRNSVRLFSFLHQTRTGLCALPSKRASMKKSVACWSLLSIASRKRASGPK